MRLYLDENITDRRVVAHLLRLGHTVLVPAEVGQAGALDATHLAYAIRYGVVLLTQDYQDFTALHDLILAAGGRHSGILLLYTENDPTRDMTPRSIAAAITTLEAAAVSLVNQLYVVNHWR
jgi:predicted nuclease of predicted toxin-antitoxin system